MKYIKIMSMIAFIGIYMAGCSQEPKRNYIFYTRENKDTKEDAPVENSKNKNKRRIASNSNE